MNEVIAVAYGGGTNSTAMLVGMKNTGIRPDYITFADTGAEKPHTYEHIKVMQEWLESVGFPPIITVHKVDKNGDRLTLEQNCLKKKMLPSIAYGFKTCSKKYKIQPQDKYFNNLPETKKVFKEGGKITKYIGYDADEPHRAKIMDDKKYRYKYPLIEWGWGRDECIEAIKAEGLPLPHKSACFFCPASKQYEIKNLKFIYNYKSPTIFN